MALALLFSGELSARADSAVPATDVANPNQRRAEELYKEGALLLGEGRYWEAEARFKESFELMKGRGTLLNLAICHENLGRLATAYVELTLLAEQALAAGDTIRLDVAREHLTWIEPQLLYLCIESPEAAQPGIQVEIDGHRVTAFDVPFPVDAGRHQLRATAPGKKDYHLDLQFETGHQPRTVAIPSLQNAAVVMIPSEARHDVSPKAVTVAVSPLAEPAPKADYAPVYIAGATTVTLTAGAIASAFAYYDRRAAYHDAINNPDSVSDAETSARRESAEQMAWINGSLIVGASLGAAVTGFLWYRASRASKVRGADRAWVAPLVVGSGGGLRAGASF